jgi:hypothetical protein
MLPTHKGLVLVHPFFTPQLRDGSVSLHEVRLLAPPVAAVPHGSTPLLPEQQQQQQQQHLLLPAGSQVRCSCACVCLPTSPPTTTADLAKLINSMLSACTRYAILIMRAQAFHGT